jgi:signal transduction histidine kinase
LLSFSICELLKNACAAIVYRYGAINVEEKAPPIIIRLSSGLGYVGISIFDTGGGFPDQAGPITTFPFFSSKRELYKQEREPTYTYSRNFGAPLEGAGVGLAKTSVCANFHGGSLSLLSQPGCGTTALFLVEMSGARGTDVDMYGLK